MNTPLTDEALQARRQELERGLQRALGASRGVLAVAALLALAAIALAYDSYLKAGRIAGHSQQLAVERQRVEAALWQTRLAHAQAALDSGRPGARAAALADVVEAARWQVSPELRDVAIAALCRTDIGEDTLFRPLAAATSGSDQASPFLYSVDPSARFATSIDTNGSLVCLELATGHVAWEMAVPNPPLDGPVVWSPDGGHVAFQDRTRFQIRRVLPAGMVVEMPPLQKPGPHLPVCFTGDGRTAFVSASGRGAILDLATGRETARFGRLPRVDHAAFHPARPWLAIGTGDRIEIWDWRQTNRLQSLILGNAPTYVHLAWAPDGSALAAAGNDGGIYIWDAATLLDPLQRWHCMRGHTLPAWNVAFSGSGDVLASCAWGAETILWNSHRNDGEILLRWSHGYGVRFGEGDRTLVLVRPNQGVAVRPLVLSPAMRRLAGPMGSPEVIRGLTFSGDEQWIAGVSHDGLFVWNAESNRIVARRPVTGAFAVLHYARENQWLIGSESGVMRLPWTVESNASGSLKVQLREPSYIPLPGGFNHVFKMALSRDETRLAVSDRRGQGYLFDLAGGGAPVTLRGQAGLDTLSFSPDARQLAAGTWQGAGTWIWDAQTGLPLHKIDSVDADVGFTGDGRWLVVSRVREHAFWHTTTNAVGWTLPREPGEQTIGRVATFPDGRTVAINESFRRALIVDAASQRVLASLVPPGDRKIEGLRVSPGGRWLAIMATQVYLYDLKGLREGLAALGLGSSFDVEGSRVTAAGVAGVGHVARNAPVPTAPHGYLAGLVLIGLLVTLFLAGVAERYQRRLLDSYFELETLSAQRREELRRTHDELRHSQKMKALGTLAAGIAHDFNNLLSVIRMANQLTAERARGDADLEENTSMVEQSVAQGKAVVRSMLGYSRAPTERTSYAVDAAVRDAALLLNQQFLRGITVRLELDAPTPAVNGVRSRLEQILLNLILNSAEAMAGEGELRLAVRPLESVPAGLVLPPRTARTYIEVTVADNGPGIAPETRQRIFEPFFTTKHTGTAQGTGLGLSMVHAIAEGEGFGLGLESEPGRGTSFRIYVPVE